MPKKSPSSKRLSSFLQQKKHLPVSYVAGLLGLSDIATLELYSKHKIPRAVTSKEITAIQQAAPSTQKGLNEVRYIGRYTGRYIE